MCRLSKTYGGVLLSALSNPLKCAALRRAHAGVSGGGARCRHLLAQRFTGADVGGRKKMRLTNQSETISLSEHSGAL